MEAFSLLKYWRNNGLVGNGGAGRTAAATDSSNAGSKNSNTTTIATSVGEMVVEKDEDQDGDEGPFFDLEFQVPEEEENDEQIHNNVCTSKEEEDDDDVVDDDESVMGSASTDGEEPEFNFAVSPNSSGGRTDPNITFSPSDDLFFKGRLVPLESSSSSSSSHLLFTDSNTKSSPQFPVSLMKTATKFRVFMLGFKKQKSTEKLPADAINESSSNTTTDHQQQEVHPKQEQQQQQQPQKQQFSKLFEVKFKIEEVPIISLFTRDNSSKNSVNKTNNVQNKQGCSSEEVNVNVVDAEEKKLISKDVVQKYLKMIKPLYVKASKRYGEKIRFSGQLSLLNSGKTGPASMSAVPAPTAKKMEEVAVTEESVEGKATTVTDEVVVVKTSQMKQGNLPAGFRVVRQHFAKSRSASSAVTPSGGAGGAAAVQAKRRDDSLLQQQDGIQSAILHCKRSFNASRDSDSFSISRSTSESISAASRTSFDEVVEARC